jgi:hypothetical protein
MADDPDSIIEDISVNEGRNIWFRPKTNPEGIYLPNLWVMFGVKKVTGAYDKSVPMTTVKNVIRSTVKTKSYHL